MNGRVRVADKVIGIDADKEMRKQGSRRVIFLDIETTKNNNSSNVERVTVKQELKSPGKVREGPRDT